MEERELGSAEVHPRCGRDRVPDVRGDARRGDAEVAPTCQVREVFTLTLNRKDRKDGFSKFTNVAGARVVSGEVRVRDRVRLWRGGEAVYDGTLASLKHFKEEARARSCAMRARKRTVPGADAELTWPPCVSLGLAARYVSQGQKCLVQFQTVCTQYCQKAVLDQRTRHG